MIPLVKPYIAPKEIIMPAIEKILYSGYIAEGEATYQFEREFGEYIGNPNVLIVNSGTSALHLALLLLNVGTGDEVISTPMTAEPTNTTIAITGAKVIWADVDEKTGLLDPASVIEKITERTKAIMLVHYAGMVCNMDKFNKISEEYNIPVIEDTAHALGSKYQGRIIGSNSRFTCYSFQAIKQMTTVDGGAIAFSDSEEVEAARHLRWFGLDKRNSRLQNDITRAGYKYGMNNVIGTIGSVQLRETPAIIKKYIKNGKQYDMELASVPGVTLVPYYEHTEPSYWLYTLKVENRQDFIKKMAEIGVMASELHKRNDWHDYLNDFNQKLPNLDKFYSKMVHLPCGWWLDRDKRDLIVNTIKSGW